MDDQTSAELQHHLDAIAKILYAEANLDPSHNLEDIEKSVRALTQKHVSPQIGFFFSKPTQVPLPDGDAL